jgi:hypothetical protein
MVIAERLYAFLKANSLVIKDGTTLDSSRTGGYTVSGIAQLNS